MNKPVPSDQEPVLQYQKAHLLIERILNTDEGQIALQIAREGNLSPLLSMVQERYTGKTHEEVRSLSHDINNLITRLIASDDKQFKAELIKLGADMMEDEALGYYSTREITRTAIRAANLDSSKETIQIYKEAGQVEVKRTQIIRCLINLIENAHKYGPKGGRVIIEVNGPSWTITTEGTSIPKDFDPFKTGTRLKKHVVLQGFGIGLSYVRKRVEEHHGLCSWKNNPDHSVSFQITLPKESPKNNAKTPEKVHLTIVEDRRELRNIFSRFCNSLQYSSRAFSGILEDNQEMDESGEKTPTNLLLEETPAYGTLLIDYSVLKETPGLLKVIQASREDIRVVVMSGSALYCDNDIQEKLDAGLIHDTLQKPFGPRELKKLMTKTS